MRPLLTILFGITSVAGVASASLVDTPLPRFSDGKASMTIDIVPGVVKRGRLQTDFVCTSFENGPVDIGVEVFGTTGTRQNDIAANQGAILNVGPGQTVTIGTGATASYLESQTIALPLIAQGSARIIASAPRVRCNVMVLDDALSPPTSLATLGHVGALVVANDVSPSLPSFADGAIATHAVSIPGVIKRGRNQTDFFCTSLASVPIHVGVQVFDVDGRLLNDVGTGNGAVLGVAPGATVTLGTTGSAGFLETATISISGTAQGSARIVSTSADVLCSALVLDSAVTPPTDLAALSALPEQVFDNTPPRGFSDGSAAAVLLTLPGIAKRTQLQTDFLCTNLGAQAVNVGIEIVGTDGTLLNDTRSGTGALLGVQPGRTVTIGTSATASFLETAVIPLTTVSQGSARIVTSAPGVQCAAILLEDTLTPPLAVSEVAAPVRLVPDPLLGRPLPSFSDAQPATHAAVFPGVIKRGRMQSDVFCTNYGTTAANVAVELFAPDGALMNQIATGQGAVLGALPGATVTIGTSGTRTFFETTVLATAGVAQGMARVVSTSGDIACNAVVLDSAVVPPIAMSSLHGYAADLLPATTPTATPTPTSTATPTPTAPPACAGDCNTDGEVTVDEVVRGVNIALGLAPLGLCPVLDRSGDGEVTVDELIAAVNAALNGCV